MKKLTNQDEALVCLTGAIIENQKKEIPIHKWKMPELRDLKNYHPETLRVEEFMTTDLFTVQKEDLIELVAEMLDWKKIQYAPIEDTKGNLVGLVTARLILRHFVRGKMNGKASSTVKDIMIEKPITVKSETTILEAMNIMRENKIGCLPVVKGKELIGIITEMDFLRISGRLIERLDGK